MTRLFAQLCLAVCTGAWALTTQAAPARPLSLAEQEALAAAAFASAPAAPKASKRKGDGLGLKSSAVLVVDEDSGEVVTAKNEHQVLPVASLTKLMTALVIVSADQPLDEMLEITREDVDTYKRTTSRLAVGTQLTRGQMLLLALMSSENRAALALSRYYSGGRKGFIAAMNAKAKALGMTSSHFADAAGLSSQSVSTASDLHRLLKAAYAHPLIRDYSTRLEDTVRVKRRNLSYINSNRLVRKGGDWDIQLQKTGFTNEAGRCLMMQAAVEGRRLAMVFLDSSGTLTRYADATRVRKKLAQQSKTSRKASAEAAHSPS